MGSVKLKFHESLQSYWANEENVLALCTHSEVVKLYNKLIKEKEIISLPEQVLFCSHPWVSYDHHAIEGIFLRVCHFSLNHCFSCGPSLWSFQACVILRNTHVTGN